MLIEEAEREVEPIEAPAVVGGLGITGEMLQSEDNCKPEKRTIVTAPDGPFEQSKGDGQPAGTVGDAEMLEVAEKVSAEAERDAGDNGRKLIAADLAGVEIHPNAGGDDGEKDCEVERDVGREQTEENKVEGIADPGLGPGQQGKAAVDLAHPEGQLARPESFAQREPIGEILIHEIAGEDVVGDEQALHQRQLPECGENQGRNERDGGPGLVPPTLVDLDRDGAGFHGCGDLTTKPRSSQTRRGQNTTNSREKETAISTRGFHTGHRTSTSSAIRAGEGGRRPTERILFSRDGWAWLS